MTRGQRAAAFRAKNERRRQHHTARDRGCVEARRLRRAVDGKFGNIEDAGRYAIGTGAA